MQRLRVDPLNVRDAPVAELPPTNDMWVEGARRRVLSHDPDTGAITYVSELPAGYRRPAEIAYRRERPAGRFEYHTCHEEGFILEGRIDFGGWYDWQALAYLNHPSTWVHPADQCAPDGALLIMKLSGPLDFAYVAISEDWDGREYAADPGRAGPHHGASSLPVDVRADGREDGSGRRWQRAWTDVASGWTTWVVQAHAGWRGVGDGWSVAGGDELFVLSGDMRTRVRGDLVHLRQGDYVSDPERFEDGGGAEASEDGFVVIRWTRGVDPV